VITATAIAKGSGEAIAFRESREKASVRAEDPADFLDGAIVE
jgi:hypothetical protein